MPLIENYHVPDLTCLFRPFDCGMNPLDVVDVSEKFFIVFIGTVAVITINWLWNRPMKWTKFPELQSNESVNEANKP